MTPERTHAARDLLAFYVQAGADAAIGEKPVDRFAAVVAAPAEPAIAIHPEVAPGPREKSPLRTLPPRGAPAERSVVPAAIIPL